MTRFRPTVGLTRTAVLVFVLMSAAACGSDGESADASTQTDTSADTAGSGEVVGEGASPDPDSSGAAVDSDPLADAPALQPSTVFEVDRPGGVNSVAVSPDGSLVAVTSQDGLGSPVTIDLHDARTGEQLETTEVDVIRLGRLHWMADGRLVAAAERTVDAEWLSWDGSTLEELTTLPLDRSCGDGQADKNTGAVYSSQGLTSMDDSLCRFDTSDGSIVRAADGVLVSAERFWVLPATGQVTVQHSPDPDAESELLTLDGATLAPGASSVVEFTDSVREVGTTAWIANTFENNTRLEPGAIPVPSVSTRSVSGAGTIFIAEGNADDIVFISATDGSVIGTIPVGMNLAFSDWSLDDSVFARRSTETQVEVYDVAP